MNGCVCEYGRGCKCEDDSLIHPSNPYPTHVPSKILIFFFYQLSYFCFLRVRVGMLYSPYTHLHPQSVEIFEKSYQFGKFMELDKCRLDLGGRIMIEFPELNGIDSATLNNAQ
jgi:hypothetical protein